MIIPNFRQKYMSLPVARPWSTISQNRFMTSHMADIDGDGCDEVIVSGCSPDESPKTAVMSYFKYALLADEWASTKMPEQLLVTEQRNMKGTEKLLFAKLRSKNVSDMLVFDAGELTLTVLGYQKTDSPPASGFKPLVLSPVNATSTTTAHVIKGQQGAIKKTDWQIDAENAFYVGDVDGDGLDEILVLSHSVSTRNDRTMLGLLKWNKDANALNVIWASANGTVPAAPSQPVWNIFTPNKFYIGDIDGDGKSEIVAFDGSSFLGVFKWDSATSQLLSVWQTSGKILSGKQGVPEWTLTSNTWFRLSDLNDDRKKELIAFNGSQLGVLGFNGSQMQVLSINSGAIPGISGAGWTITPGQIHYVANFQAAGTDSIFVVSNAKQNFAPSTEAMLKWNAATPGFIAEPVPVKVINLITIDPLHSGVNNYTTADVDGDGLAELIIQNDSTKSLRYMKWQNGSFTQIWSAKENSGQQSLQSWGIGTIANGPVTSFEAYWASKPEAYKKIYEKASLTLTFGEKNDIQVDEYTNGAAQTLSSWAGSLQDAAAIPNPVGDWEWINNFNRNDINEVFHQLETEVTGAACSMSLRANLTTLYNNIREQREKDYDNIWKNQLTLAPPNTTQISWTEKVNQVIIGGLQTAMTALTPEIALGYSLINSLWLSTLDASTTEASSTKDFKDIKKLILDNIDQQRDAALVLQDKIIADPIKLRFFGRMSLGNWSWNVTSDYFNRIVKETSKGNRLLFYHMLLGKMFKITRQTGGNCKFLGWTLRNIPESAQWYDIREYGCDQYYMDTLDQGSAFGYPGDELFKDLNDLQIPKSVLFKGGGNLNITITENKFGLFEDSRANFFTTNKTDKKVWITVRNIHKNLKSGWLNPGESLIWAPDKLDGDSIGYLLNQVYHIKAEVKSDAAGNNPTIHTTEIELYPMGGFGKIQDVAVKLLKGDNNYYWEKVSTK